jgi:tetratricopeptide (TPR) repeat protein
LRNVRPDVLYVGDARCAECHPKQAATYRDHPMARTLAPIARVAPGQPYDREHHNPFEAIHTRFLVERQGDRVWHRQTGLDADGRPAFRYDLDVAYVVGSGRGGYSYLTDRDGYLFQTPISWYAQKQIWDLSPGFAAEQFGAAQRTGRPVTADCLFCHANRAHPRPGSQNRYDEPIFSGYGIGCERCHGPGGRHAETLDPLDVVNPGKLDWPLREDVCSQCHLEGVERVLRRGRDLYDFRPGLPLDAFLSVFVYPAGGDAGDNAVNHVEQLRLSRCFRESSGPNKLGCVSCHDPHAAVGPERRVAYYRGRCLACHTEESCTLPRPERLRADRDDSCIACHMPRYGAGDVAHTAATDHRIPRRPRGQAAPPGPGSRPGPGPLLVPFGRDAVADDDRGLRRDLGVALVQAASKGMVDPPRAGRDAAALLLPALQEGPEDVEAWEAQGWALALEGRPPEALEAFEAALARDPNRERSLVAAASFAEESKRADLALSYWHRAVAANPWIPQYRQHLAGLLLDRGAWDELPGEAQAWLRLDPGSAEARMLWITCLAHDGKKTEARAEFARLEALRPANLDSLRNLFEKEMQ